MPSLHQTFCGSSGNLHATELSSTHGLGPIVPTQHCPEPPGRLPHPSPPHVPQESAQQWLRFLFRMPSLHHIGGSVGNLHATELSSTHGLGPIVPTQHCPEPPGRLPHPSPPHVPQESLQQWVPFLFRMPCLHHIGGGVGNLHATDVPSTHGLGPIEPTQHAALPPARLPHPSPPHVPQDAAQQWLRFSFRMPVLHICGAAKFCTPPKSCRPCI